MSIFRSGKISTDQDLHTLEKRAEDLGSESLIGEFDRRVGGKMSEEHVKGACVSNGGTIAIRRNLINCRMILPLRSK